MHGQDAEEVYRGRRLSDSGAKAFFFHKVAVGVADLSPAQIVERFKSLADIERGFKVLKSEIEIALIFHRVPEPIRAYASICLMTLTLYRALRLRLKAAGHSASLELALAQLRRIQKQSGSINQGVPITGISNINCDQAEIFSSMNFRKPAPDPQLNVLWWKSLSVFHGNHLVITLRVELRGVMDAAA